MPNKEFSDVILIWLLDSFYVTFTTLKETLYAVILPSTFMPLENACLRFLDHGTLCASLVLLDVKLSNKTTGEHNISLAMLILDP
ncbi:hypothetical protein L1987_24969 [Smallanthus sonchifolius]|uniref:Uncharacterized protein n=1 Tax=Smallanthus sonchifolius TaxID=185202 RepID=A0ACB9IL72_9ASTR|nr:hypothetical protein L1987_24969 [Smallanthus sonchifolius]